MSFCQLAGLAVEGGGELPQLVELFVNFGWTGVLLGMAAIGALYRVLYARLNQPGVGEGTTLLAAVVFAELVNIESDFSLVFGGLLQTAVVLYFVLRTCAPLPGRVQAVSAAEAATEPDVAEPDSDEDDDFDDEEEYGDFFGGDFRGAPA